MSGWLVCEKCGMGYSTRVAVEGGPCGDLSYAGSAKGAPPCSGILFLASPNLEREATIREYLTEIATDGLVRFYARELFLELARLRRPRGGRIGGA